MIALVLLACVKTPPPSWPGAGGRTCDDQLLVRIEPDPWATPTTLDGRPYTGPTERVVPSATLRGTTVTVDDATCALTGATADLLSCGDVQIAVHTRPLCDAPVHDDVVAVASLPLTRVDPLAVDATDGVIDNGLPVAHQLVVDTSRPCGPNAVTFGERERAVRTGRTPSTCGGRTPGGRAIDVQLTHLVNGADRLPPGAPYWGTAPASDAPLRSSGTVGPPVLTTFPYLAPVP